MITEGNGMNTECIGCGEPTPDSERVGDGLCEACAKPDFEFPAQQGRWATSL